MAGPSVHRKLSAYADGASAGVQSKPSYALRIQREGYHLRSQPQDLTHHPSCDGHGSTHPHALQDVVGNLVLHPCVHYGGRDGLPYELDADHLLHLRGLDPRWIPHLIIYREQLVEAVHRTIGWDECPPPSVGNYHLQAVADCKSVVCLMDLSRSRHQLHSCGAGWPPTR